MHVVFKKQHIVLFGERDLASEVSYTTPCWTAKTNGKGSSQVGFD